MGRQNTSTACHWASPSLGDAINTYAWALYLLSYYVNSVLAATVAAVSLSNQTELSTAEAGAAALLHDALFNMAFIFELG